MVDANRGEQHSIGLLPVFCSFFFFFFLSLPYVTRVIDG